MNDIYFALIFILSALDAMRDGFRTNSYQGISNKQWHIIKWLSWYPLMILLAFQLDFAYMVASPLLAWFGWQFGILWTPVKWHSMWLEKIKNLFKK